MPNTVPFNRPARDRIHQVIGRRAVVGLGAAALLLAACGGDPAPISAPAAAPASEAPVEAASVEETPSDDTGPSIPAATASSSDLGEILVGEDGLTLYGFTNDIDATSACSGTCADAWPPLIVDADWQVAPGLDAGIFATTTRDDGQLQLVAGKWPLYYFAGDATAGDVNGQGSGDVWFVAATDGSLITGDDAAIEQADAPAEAPVTTGSTSAGDVLVDVNGLSLYGFTPDEAGAPTCGGACANAWPPLLVPTAELPDGLDPAIFSVVEGLEGGFHLRAGIWPLYTFAGDAAAGDINGQGSGGNWFLAAPDGSLITGDAAVDAADASSRAPAGDAPAPDQGGYDY